MSELLLTTSLLQPAKLYPNKPALICGESRYSYRQFFERVQRVANGLAGLGLAKGDRVAVLMLNCHRYLELYYATAFAGLVVNPLNIRLAAPELVYILNDSASLALAVDDAFLPLLQAIKGQIPTVSKLIYVGSHEAPQGMVHYEALLERSSATTPKIDLREDDLAGIFYTGGTTGNPKGVMLSHRNLTCNAYNTMALAMYKSSDVYLHAAPMFHLANGAAMYTVTWRGGTHTFVKAFEPKAVLETVQRERVTTSIWVPVMINALINYPDCAQYDISSLRRITYGASPIPVEVLRKAMRMFGCEFGQGYGMTEASPLVTLLEPEDHVTDGPPAQVRRLASCGREIIGVQVRIVNEAGEDVAPGEVGEIIIRGPNIMQGYWNKPEETAAVLREGWYYSGDMGCFDEERFIFLVDRRKDMIVSGGENVYSTEVENAIYSHPAVLEAAVIGVPDERWGEAVKAVVVLRPGHTLSSEEVIEHCRRQIAGYKLPKSVDFAAALPKSGAGKILKRELREPYWAGYQRRIH